MFKTTSAILSVLLSRHLVLLLSAQLWWPLIPFGSPNFPPYCASPNGKNTPNPKTNLVWSFKMFSSQNNYATSRRKITQTTNPQCFCLWLLFLFIHFILKSHWKNQFSYTCWGSLYQLGKLIKDEFWIKKAPSLACWRPGLFFCCRSQIWQWAYHVPLSIRIFPAVLEGNVEVPEMECKSNIY